MMFANFLHETRTPRALGLLLLLAGLATGCSSGGGSDLGVLPADLAASFAGSGTPGAANVIRLSGSSVGDRIDVEVRIGGPTTSADIYSFAFDLVLGDTNVAEYLEGSATVGGALTTTGGQTLQVLAARQGPRVTIGVTKLGGGPGNAVDGTDESTVVTLAFRLLREGSTTLTIEGSSGAEPAALDSSGSEIDSVTFDTEAATLLGI